MQHKHYANGNTNTNNNNNKQCNAMLQKHAVQQKQSGRFCNNRRSQMFFKAVAEPEISAIAKSCAAFKTNPSKIKARSIK